MIITTVKDIHLLTLHHVFCRLGEVAQACVAKIPVTWEQFILERPVTPLDIEHHYHPINSTSMNLQPVP